MSIIQLKLLLGLIYTQTILSGLYPTCGDCWCIPSNNGTSSCPNFQPQTTFSNHSIEVYKSKIPLNALALNCNPYYDSSCVTIPPQVMLDEETAVCALSYPRENNYDKKCNYYTMVTYKNREEAVSTGAVVTHEGSCGLCSTTQDLALYLRTDFTNAGKLCATKGLFNETAGLECYMSLGLTKECAKIWNYDGIYDGKLCSKTCIGDISSPNNGPPPGCELNDCLKCDEELAGPIFTSFAGRTRRRSGLLSEIVRPCDSIAWPILHDPCFDPFCLC
eukprot:gene12369-16592_t